MDLSFDKLLEQFDLKKNEHQKNMHKINKRIDEIEENMVNLKEQIRSFDHQIANIERDLKTTLNIVHHENISNHHHENKEEIHQKNKDHSEQKKNQQNWAENQIENVEELTATIANKLHLNHHQEENKSHLSKHNNNSYSTINQGYTQGIESIFDENTDTTSSYISSANSNHTATNLTSMNHKNFSEIDVTNTNQYYSEFGTEPLIDITPVQKSIEKNQEELEIDYTNLSIGDWEDKTTNLSMSEWFEVDPDPRSDR